MAWPMHERSRVEASGLIALVGPDGLERRNLACYLAGSGYEVRITEPPPETAERSRFLIWLTIEHPASTRPDMSLSSRRELYCTLCRERGPSSSRYSLNELGHLMN